MRRQSANTAHNLQQTILITIPDEDSSFSIYSQSSAASGYDQLIGKESRNECEDEKPILKATENAVN